MNWYRDISRNDILLRAYQSQVKFTLGNAKSLKGKGTQDVKSAFASRSTTLITRQLYLSEFANLGHVS